MVMNGFIAFIGKYKGLFIAVGAIGAMHYGWYQLQYNDTFVKPDEKRRIAIPGTGQTLHLDDFSISKRN